MQADRQLVAHGAGGDEQRRFFPEQAGRHLLQPVDGRVLTEDVVADIRVHHRLTHGGRGLGHRVTAQVNHHDAVLQKKTTAIRFEPSS